MEDVPTGPSWPGRGVTTATTMRATPCFAWSVTTWWPNAVCILARCIGTVAAFARATWFWL